MIRQRLSALAGGALLAATAAHAQDLSSYVGRWDVTLEAPGKPLASWLDITAPEGKPHVRMVGRWGHPRDLPQADFGPNGLRFTSPKEEEGRDTDMVFEARREGDGLRGTTTGPDGTVWPWRAERAPTLERKRKPVWDKKVTLFGGRGLAAWHASDPDAKPAWSVERGLLVSPGNGAELISNQTFGDFRLHLEFRYPGGANSGVYLRGRYEVQIEDDAASEPPERRLGGVYGILAPDPPAPRKTGAWRRYDITLIGRRVTVVLDGVTLIQDAEIPSITGGALDSHEGLPGAIYLQGSEPGRVEFRNIVVTPARPQ